MSGDVCEIGFAVDTLVVRDVPPDCHLIVCDLYVCHVNGREWTTIVRSIVPDITRCATICLYGMVVARIGARRMYTVPANSTVLLHHIQAANTPCKSSAYFDVGVPVLLAPCGGRPGYCGAPVPTLCLSESRTVDATSVVCAFNQHLDSLETDPYVQCVLSTRVYRRADRLADTGYNITCLDCDASCGCRFTNPRDFLLHLIPPSITRVYGLCADGVLDEWIHSLDMIVPI